MNFNNFSFNFNPEFHITKNDLILGFNLNYLYYLPKSFDTAKVFSTGIYLAGLYGNVGLNYFSEKYSDDSKYFTPGIFTTLKIPRLLPIKNPLDFTVNLPLELNFSLCNGLNNFMNFNAELTLFSAEIQKSVPLIPLYANRFSVTSNYFIDFYNKELASFSFNDFKEKITDLKNNTNMIQGITVSSFFEITPVIGSMINLKSKFGVDFTYYFDNILLNKNKPYEITVAGMFTF